MFVQVVGEAIRVKWRELLGTVVVEGMLAEGQRVSDPCIYLPEILESSDGMCK